MAASMNRVTLVGNLGQDPDVRNTNAGDTVTNLSMATTEEWRDKDGEKHSKTDWHRVAMFGKVAEIAAKYLTKGAKVLIEGRLQTRKWTDKEGNDRYTTEVVVSGWTGRMLMLGEKGGKSGSGGDDNGERQSSRRQEQQSEDDFDDDIPF